MKINKPLLAAVILCAQLTLTAADLSDVPYDYPSPEGETDTNTVSMAEWFDPTVPTASGIAQTNPLSPNYSTNFPGPSFDFATSAPDTHAAVGPNHIMIMLNSETWILDRAGSKLYTNTTFNWWRTPSDENSWPTVQVTDPRVIYDPYSSRWIATMIADQRLVNCGLMIAVSEGSDPTQGWYYKKIDADPATSNFLWADYPSIGFNKNFIAVGVNMTAGNAFHHARMYVFDKARAYTNGWFYVQKEALAGWGGTIAPAVTYDNTVETLYCVNMFLARNAMGKGQIQAYKITKSGGTTNFAAGPYWETSSPWADTGGVNGSGVVTNFGPQLDSTIRIMCNDSRIQNVVYRNGSLYATHTVFYPATGARTSSSIQVWKTPVNTMAPQRWVIQEPGIFFAFPSIAVNAFDDILVGFSYFSSTNYASGGYIHRVPSAETTFLREKRTLKSGLATYDITDLVGRVRWGDYSATLVDPINNRDFWTYQEYAESRMTNGNTPRWGTWLGQIQIGAPENDYFASALVLTNGAGTNSSSLFRATLESSSETNLYLGTLSTRSVWYSWTAPATGVVTFDTATGTTNGLDTILAAYTGTSLSSLTFVAGNDDSKPKGKLVLQSILGFTATANTTYYIRVTAKSAPTENGDKFTLMWNQPSMPEFKINPDDYDILGGDTLELESFAIGVPAPSYQWWSNGVAISGATYRFLTNVTATNSVKTTNFYWAVATNSHGSVSSLTSTVIVHTSATATLGEWAYLTNDLFRIEVTGIPGYEYLVQYSTTLTNWTTIWTDICDFTFTHTNTANTNPAGFLRVLYNP